MEVRSGRVCPSTLVMAAVLGLGGICFAQTGGQPTCVITDNLTACDYVEPVNDCPIYVVGVSPVCNKVHARDCNIAADASAIGNLATTPSSAVCFYKKQTKTGDECTPTGNTLSKAVACTSGSGTTCSPCPGGGGGT